jgi:hypothetical protein
VIFSINGIIFYFFLITFVNNLSNVSIWCLAKDNLTEFSSKAAVFVINTENYSENSFAAGDLITNLNGVELVGEYQTIQNKMRRLSDSHNFSGTVIRNGKKMKVREPEINDEKKTILHVAFFSYSSIVCAFP